MRAIILLIAILACASARLNTAQVYRGFTNKLGFTQEHHNELKACSVEIATLAKTYLAPGKAALQAKVLGLLFADDAKHREALVSVVQFAQTALPVCKKFAQSFVALVASKSKVTQDEKYFNNLLKYRFQKYSGEIISSLVTILELHKNENDIKVGATIAYILELVTGMEHPQSMLEYIQSYKAPIEVSVLETDRFIQQTLNTIAKELGGAGQVSEERVKELRVAFQGVVAIYMNTYMKLHQVSTFVEREVIILGAVRDLVKAAAVVRENLGLTLQSLHLQFNPSVLRKLPGRALVNYFKNLPTLQRTAIDIGFGLRSHHPVQTGQAVASFLKTLTKTH